MVRRERLMCPRLTCEILAIRRWRRWITALIYYILKSRGEKKNRQVSLFRLKSGTVYFFNYYF